MKKPFIFGMWLLILLFIPSDILSAQSESAAEPQTVSWYVGTNPLALVNVFTGYASGYMQYFSASELGPVVIVGCFPSAGQAFELRLSCWVPNNLEFFTQGSLSWKIFPFGTDESMQGGFYMGPDLRIGDQFYHVSGVNYANAVPSVEAGWYIPLENFYLNVRLIQSIAVVTFCSDPAVAPAAAWMFSSIPSVFPVVPVISLDTGIRF